MNFGREEDYRALGELGVNVSGCVVLVRKGGGMSRAAAVERAERNGAAAVLIYSEGDRFRKGFERGTVMRGLGDPLSPGWAGVDGGERLGLDDHEVSRRFPKIPSLPLSFEDAEVILASLGGAPAPPEWRNSKVDSVGPGPTVVDFVFQVGFVFDRLWILVKYCGKKETNFCFFFFWEDFFVCFFLLLFCFCFCFFGLLGCFLRKVNSNGIW